MDATQGISIPPLGVVLAEERRGLYWATSGFAFPVTSDKVIQPRGYVVKSPLYHRVVASLDPNDLVELDRRRTEYVAQPSLEKCVAEAMSERVREQLLPEAPSRLTCLWATLDAYGALQFAFAAVAAQVLDASGMSNIGATPVSTADGKWVALDMRLFSAPEHIGADASANAAAPHRRSHRLCCSAPPTSR
jgi:hypothetical protein